MRRIICILITCLLFSYTYAKDFLDTAIDKISEDICVPLDIDTILCILDFSSPNKSMSEYIQTQLTSRITASGKFRIVTRAHMDKVNKELDFQMSGLVNDETALSICERLGAQSIVFGQLKELDNKYILEIKMIDVETASYQLFKTYEFERSSKTEQLLGRAAIYNKTALGITLEANKNSISNMALGGGITFDYALARKIVVGLRINASADLFEIKNTIFSVEPLGALRFYAVSPTGEPVTGIFAEGQGGVTLIFINSEFKNSVNAGISLGYRQGLGTFYFETFVRCGYPYLLGAGLNFGFRF